MSILDRFVRVYAPFTCLGCGVEQDKLLCASCVETVSRVPSRCYRCHATTKNYAVCPGCRRKTPLRHVAVWAFHSELPKALVWQSKYERAEAGLGEMAEHMSELTRYFPSDCILTPVPTATSRVRSRGYDQAKKLARGVGRRSSLEVANLLMRVGQAHQVGATRSERLAHLQNAFRPVRIDQIKGAHIVLVDDVCTTGATLESAARTLRAAGAKQVDAIVFSQPI